MAELALYRKYRSQHFDEVLGQKHIVATIKSALKSGRISHAYLFTGPRGTGKTSVARLLAQSINCESSQTSDRLPCGKCRLCLIPLASNLDIYEIDAASNRRIDEVRDLRDKIGLSPSMGRFKVYIIDEVHMLTTEAFNALLKTLEEPPAHAIFILATTEAHKLPETIVSRTQRFNFKPITAPDLELHLNFIATRESIKIDAEAIKVLAQASRGGFRDAISLLDQVAGSGTGMIDAATVRLILGWSDLETIDQISIAIAESKPAAAISCLDRSFEQGAQATQVMAQLSQRWRGFMLDAVHNQVAQGQAERAVTQHMSLPQIVAVIDQLAAAAKSAWPELALESTLIKLAASTAETNQPAPAGKPAVVVPETAPEPGDQRADLSPDQWTKVLLVIKEHNNSLYALLRSCSVSIGQQDVTITCRFKFHRERIRESKNILIIEAALKKIYGGNLKVVCTLDETKARTAAEPTPEVELVTSALEIFGGEVIDE